MMRQWSKAMLLTMVANIPMPSQSNVSQAQFQTTFQSTKDVNLNDILLRGFKYLKEKGVNTINVPNGVPLDLKGFNRITSIYGARFHPIKKKWLKHAGIDFSGHLNTDIYSTGDGHVQFIGRKHGYGKVVVINHGHGIQTMYAHLNSFSCSKGDEVKKGDVIAKLGNTGVSTGPHLHYEVRLNDEDIDPMPLLISEDQDQANLETILKQEYEEQLARKSNEDSYYSNPIEFTRPV